MIVMVMTSWKMRINNVVTVVKSVLDNTILPDKLYLTLAVEEFPNKENDLPNNLVDLFNSNERLIINWVDKNIKTMKKVFPVLKYLNDDDFIINIDDDAIIPREAIEYRINEFNGEPITSCNKPRIHMIDSNLNMYCCGPFSIFKKKFLNHWDEFVNDEIIKTYNDDYTYTMICWLNGYKFVPCKDYSRHTGISEHRLPKYNTIFSSYRLKVYIDRDEMYDILKKRVKEITGLSVKDSFGYYNKK